MYLHLWVALIGDADIAAEASSFGHGWVVKLCPGRFDNW
jgi:hypothetical protein